MILISSNHTSYEMFRYSLVSAIQYNEKMNMSPEIIYFNKEKKSMRNKELQYFRANVLNDDHHFHLCVKILGVPLKTHNFHI